MKTKLIRITLLALLPLTPAAFAQTKEKAKEEGKKPAVKEVIVVEAPAPGTLATAINDAATFAILSKALKAADLELTLGDPKGSFTVFAPTDEAFMKLKEGTLDKLFLPENKEKLRSLLMFHVIPGQFTSSELKEGKLTTANGEKMDVDIDGHTIKVEEAKVFKSDLVLKNGIMHSIDKVIVPKSLDGFAGLDEE